MKKKKLVKVLKGAKIIRQGGRHEFWESHSEIDENLAREILKQAEK